MPKTLHRFVKFLLATSHIYQLQRFLLAQKREKLFTSLLEINHHQHLQTVWILQSVTRYSLILEGFYKITNLRIEMEQLNFYNRKLLYRYHTYRYVLPESSCHCFQEIPKATVMQWLMDPLNHQGLKHKMQLYYNDHHIFYTVHHILNITCICTVYACILCTVYTGEKT